MVMPGASCAYPGDGLSVSRSSYRRPKQPPGHGEPPAAELAGHDPGAISLVSRSGEEHASGPGAGRVAEALAELELEMGVCSRTEQLAMRASGTSPCAAPPAARGRARP